MNIAFYIAKRYAFRFSNNAAINVIALIAAVGIIASSMALFVVMSVFSGLRDFSLSFSNDTDPDLRIVTLKGKSFYLNDKIFAILQNKDISNFSFYVEEKAMFRYGDKEIITTFKGVDSQFNNITQLQSKIISGKWINSNSNDVVVGLLLADKLNLGLYDYNKVLEVYIPKTGEGLIENLDDSFEKEPLVSTGVIQVSEEFDQKYIFCDIRLIQQMLHYKNNQMTGIEIKAKPGISIEKLQNELSNEFGLNFEIKNKTQINDSLYKMLNTENLAVYLIFTLVLIIALFNLVGALIMLIIDKKPDLKTMLNLGLEIKQIRKIFLFQGLIIAFFGGIIGITLGYFLVLLQEKFHLVMITSQLPYPVKLEWDNLIIVFLTILSLGYIASKMASNSINKKSLK